MEGFTNETIETAALPRFEEVILTPLNKAYYRIMLFNITFFHAIAGAGIGCLLYFSADIARLWYIPFSGWVISLILALIISYISFKNKGFAFRTHDVIYRSGAIAISTIIIPYNRVQHVALHEGWLSRRFGLAAIEIFTAGGSNSDVTIPGLEKEHAEKIKLLLMGKVLNLQADEQQL